MNECTENLMCECPICGEPVDNEACESESKILQRCTHHEQMHNDCLLLWLKHQVTCGQAMTCPICRQEYATDDNVGDLVAEYELPYHIAPPEDAHRRVSDFGTFHSRYGTFREGSFLVKHQIILIFGLLLSFVACVLFFMLYDTHTYIVLAFINVATMMAIRCGKRTLILLASFPWAFHAMLIVDNFELCEASNNNEFVCTQIYLPFDLLHFVGLNVIACLLGRMEPDES